MNEPLTRERIYDLLGLDEEQRKLADLFQTENEMLVRVRAAFVADLRLLAARESARITADLRERGVIGQDESARSDDTPMVPE